MLTCVSFLVDACCVVGGTCWSRRIWLSIAPMGGADVRRLLVSLGWAAVAVVALGWLFVASAALAGLATGLFGALL